MPSHEGCAAAAVVRHTGPGSCSRRRWTQGEFALPGAADFIEVINVLTHGTGGGLKTAAYKC
jgi:hypothetical protein